MMFVTTIFAPAFASIAAEYENESATQALVGVGGRLFAVHQDGDVIEPQCGYAVIGSGATYALGALHARGPTMIAAEDPERVMEYALRASEAHCCQVKGPMVFVHTPKCKR